MNDDNANMDPIVGFRRPKNKTSPRMRHLALNADALRLIRDCTESIDHLENNVSIKMLLIAFMINHEEDEEETFSVSSSSKSSLNVTNYFSDSNSESSILNKNESNSDLSIQFSDDNDAHEERLIAFSLLTNVSIDSIQTMMNELFIFSSLQQLEVDSCNLPNLPKMKRTFDSLTNHECYGWTRFSRAVT